MILSLWAVLGLGGHQTTISQGSYIRYPAYLNIYIMIYNSKDYTYEIAKKMILWLRVTTT